jgi:predicted Zn-dependent protease
MAQTDSFEGGAFHPGFPKGRSSGTLHLTPSHVRFTCAQGGFELPLEGLQAEEGGASDRLIFFKHPQHPGCSIYTDDQTALGHRSFRHHRGLQGQKASIVKKRWRGRAVIGAVALALALGIAGLWAAKGPMVGAIARQVPASWEEKLGEMVFKQISSRSRLIEVPALQRQLETITGPLVAGVKSDRYQFKFHIVEDASLNAFALPGGTVAIHSGLLLRAQSPEEIAGVLAHEISHVTRQHSLRNMIETLGLYAILGAFFGDAEGLMAVLAEHSGTLLQLKFSRDFERDADEQGWQAMRAADINPHGMITMFQKLDEEHEAMRQKTGVLGGGIEAPDFLSTHPHTKDRVADLQERWAKLDKKTGYRTFDLNFKELQTTLRSHLSKQPASPKKEPKEKGK